MKTVVLGDPPPAVTSLIQERHRLGLDRHDEVWQGEYHMAPAPSSEHARVETRLAVLLDAIADRLGFYVTASFNLGSSADFRVPDLGVHRHEPHGTWVATAAIVVEVRSPDDETCDKFPFFADHGVDEILVADLVTRTVRWFVRDVQDDHGYRTADVSALLGIDAAAVSAAVRW